MKKNQNKIQKLSVLFIAITLISCSSNKVVFPTQIEYSTNSQVVVDEFITYIQSMGYKVLNPNDTRMTMMSQNGFLSAEYIETDWKKTGVFDQDSGAEYIETDWKKTGVFDQDSGAEYIVKQKVWITLDMPGMITVESVFGYNNSAGEFIVSKSASTDLHRGVIALPEGLKNLVSSKSL